jgi:hypothetical protein
MRVCVFGRYMPKLRTDLSASIEREHHFAMLAIKKAIKDEAFKTHADLNIGSKSFKLTQKTREEVLKALFEDIANDLCNYWSRNVAIVPIPGSAIVDPDQSDFRNADYAATIAAASNGMIEVSRALHWDSVQEKQRADTGPRRMEARMEHMEVKRVPTLPVLLFDDVMTSGSTLKAAEALLKSKNAVVLGAVVVLKADSLNEPRLGFEVIDLEDDFAPWPTS